MAFEMQRMNSARTLHLNGNEESLKPLSMTKYKLQRPNYGPVDRAS